MIWFLAILMLITCYLLVVNAVYMKKVDDRLDSLEDMLALGADPERGPLEEKYGPPNVWMIFPDRDRSNVVHMPPRRRVWTFDDGGPGSAA